MRSTTLELFLLGSKDFRWMGEIMRAKQVDDLIISSSLIMHLVNHNHLSDKEIRRIEERKRDSLVNATWYIMKLKGLGIVDIEPFGKYTYFRYIKPDVTSLNI